MWSNLNHKITEMNTAGMDAVSDIITYIIHHEYDLATFNKIGERWFQKGGDGFILQSLCSSVIIHQIEIGKRFVRHPTTS